MVSALVFTHQKKLMRYFTFLLLFMLTSCSAIKERRAQKEELKSWGVQYWKQEFKDMVLCDCLLAGIGDEYVTRKFHEVDRSLYSPIRIFDSLSTEILKPVLLKMSSDSLESLERMSEAAAGKRVLDPCLEFNKSKKLDSIVKAEDKKWRKLTHQQIRYLVIGKFPTF